MINLYTDGACNWNKAGGWCCYSPELHMCFCNRKENTSNNEMELFAIAGALMLLRYAGIGDTAVTIHSDSAWAIGSITKDWNLKEHIELVNKIKALIKKLNEHNNLEINFNKVSGHSGIEGNEICDHYAVVMSNLNNYTGTIRISNKCSNNLLCK